MGLWGTVGLAILRIGCMGLIRSKRHGLRALKKVPNNSPPGDFYCTIETIGITSIGTFMRHPEFYLASNQNVPPEMTVSEFPLMAYSTSLHYVQGKYLPEKAACRSVPRKKPKSLSDDLPPPFRCRNSRRQYFRKYHFGPRRPAELPVFSSAGK